jgi:hypothetical protein
MKRYALLACALLLSGCQSTMTPSLYLQKKGVSPPETARFYHCRSYGCSKIDTINMEDVSWPEIEALFLPEDKVALSAEQERMAISLAIAEFETQIGALTGTEKDVAGTYIKWGRYQHDCVDESVNTTTYLMLLEQKNLLNHHEIGTPTARLFITTGRPGPHQSATIIDKKTGIKYAADSWFHDNGHRAEIVPMDKWLYGWRPEKIHHKP